MGTLCCYSFLVGHVYLSGNMLFLGGGGGEGAQIDVKLVVMNEHKK